MKTIKYFVMVILAAFLFAGCGGNQVKVPAGMKKPDNFYISKKENFYEFYWGTSVAKKSNMISKYGRMFNIIADYGLKNGYSYMAMVSKQFNNLSGYPINSWTAMKQFIDIYHTKHYNVSFYKQLNAGNQPVFKVVYFKTRPKGIFVWDLKQLKADTDKYTM